MIDPTELSNIIIRLALADLEFVEQMLASAKGLGKGLFPDDIKHLEKWASSVATIREILGKFDFAD